MWFIPAFPLLIYNFPLQPGETQLPPLVIPLFIYLSMWFRSVSLLTMSNEFIRKSTALYVAHFVNRLWQEEKGTTENDIIGWRHRLSLGKLQEVVKDRGTWRAAVHGVTKAGHNWVTEQQQQSLMATNHSHSCLRNFRSALFLPHLLQGGYVTFLIQLHSFFTVCTLSWDSPTIS